MKRIVVIYDSPHGHTAKLAQAVQEGADSVPGVAATLHPVATLDEAFWAAVKQADAVVLGSPTYMGTVTTAFKNFMDRSSPEIFRPEAWRDKLAAGFTNSASLNGDKYNTLLTLVTFAMQNHMVWVGLGLPPANNSSRGHMGELNRLGSFMGAMAQSNADEGPEMVPPAADLATARYLGRRVAHAALAWQPAQAGAA